MFGTQTNRFMVRTSTVLAAIFLTTSLVLAVYGSKGEKSLMSNKSLLPKTQAKPVAAQPEVTVKVSAPHAMEKLDNAIQPVVNAAK